MHYPDGPHVLRMVLLFVAALWAGVQNQLAGGGSFLTLPARIGTQAPSRAQTIAEAEGQNP